MAQNLTLTPTPELEDIARQQGGLVDITDAKNLRNQATNNIKPFSTKVEVSVTERIPQQDLARPTFNIANNNPTPPPRVITPPESEDEPSAKKGFAGYVDPNRDENQAGSTDIFNQSKDRNLNGRPDIEEKTQVEVTADVTVSSQEVQQTSGSYNPQGASEIYKQPKPEEKTQSSVNPTKSAKVKAGVIHDQTAVNQAIEQLNLAGLRSTNGEKVLRSLGLTQDTIGEKIRTEGYNPNYYQELEQYAGDVIRSRIKKLEENQPSTQVPSLSEKSGQATSKTNSGQAANQPRTAPIPYATTPAKSNSNRSKSNIPAAALGALPGLGSIMEAGALPTNADASQGKLDPSNPKTETNTARQSEGQAANTPQQGQIPSQQAEEAQKPFDNTVGNSDLGELGVKGDGTGQRSVGGEQNPRNQRNIDRFSPETRDEDAGPYFNLVNPETGQINRQPLPDTDEFKNPPDYQGRNPSQEVDYQGQSEDKQAYLREQALQANQSEQEKVQNTPGIIEEKDQKLKNLKKSEQGLEQAAQTGANPAGQKNKLQEAIDAKLKGLVAKAVLTFVTNVLPWIIAILLFVTLFITVLQTYADAYYCKSGPFRAVADVAGNLGATLSPAFKIVRDLSSRLIACDKANQNSSSPDCNGNSGASGATGTVVVSGCLTKAIDGKKDEDVLILWKANGISPVKNVPIAVGEFRKVIRIFSKAGLSQKDTDDSVAFVISLMATESGGAAKAWDFVNGRIDYDAAKGDDPGVRDPLYCIGVSQLCPRTNDGYKFGMETWAATAGVKLDESLRQRGYGLINYPETTPKIAELRYIEQAKVINAGRKDKLAAPTLRGKSDAFKAASLWLGGGCDDYGTCSAAYGEAAEKNYNELFGSCATQQPPIAANPTPTTYAKLEEKLRDAVLKPETSVQSDWKWFNPLGSVDALAQDSIKPLTAYGKVIPAEEIAFMDGLAKNAGFKKYGDSGAAAPNFVKALNAMIAASNGKLKIIGGQETTNGYRTPTESYIIFTFQIDPADRWKPGMSSDEINRITPAYKKRLLSVAPPYWSEHTGGIAVDFDLLGDGILADSPQMRNSEGYKFLQANKGKYGFVESYPAGSTIGAGAEPWHWRFDGNAEYPPAPNSSPPDGATSTIKTDRFGNPCPKPGGTSSGSAYTGTLDPNGWIRPIQDCWVITSPFGYRIHPITGVSKLHGGQDIGCPEGTKVVAVKDGKVIAAGWMDGGYGNWVKIDHGGAVSLYGHNSVVRVTVGQEVKQGTHIADVGSTGFSTGPHLHFEIKPGGGDPVDPCGFIKC